jgi:hypothetical protein
MRTMQRAFHTYVFAKYPAREAVDLCRMMDEVIEEAAGSETRDVEYVDSLHRISKELR